MIKSKLKDNRGATLIFAMVALVVAVIVCAVVIYAAQSNAGRIRSAQKAQQDLLTLNSAASVFREELAGSGIELVKTNTITTRRVGNATPTEIVSPDSIDVTYTHTDTLGRRQVLASGTYSQENALVLTEGSLSVLRNQILAWTIDILTGTGIAQSSCSTEYVIKVTSADGTLEDVHVKLRLEPGGTDDLPTQEEREAHEAEKGYLTAVFSIPGSDAEVITVTFMATVKNTKTTTLVGKSSKTEEYEGTSVVVSEQTIKINEKMTLDWADANVVVNVADKTGGAA